MKTKNLLSETFTEPLVRATKATIDIHAGDGNLIIDGSAWDAFASGELQYLEKQARPTRKMAVNNGHASFVLRGGASKQPWFHMPWSACNGATEWQVHLNPGVSADLTAESDGGNIRLDLGGMAISRVSAGTCGGNITVALPAPAGAMSLVAKTGAGNVSVDLPAGVPARIHATTGLGKAIIDSSFTQIDKFVYQTPDFAQAADKVEIKISSGAGNVVVNVV